MANTRITFDRFYKETLEKDTKFIYKDIHAFRNKRLITTNDIDILAISNSIRNLMEFKPGQRLLDKNFGNPLYIYLYEPMNNSDSYKIQLQSSAMAYIEKYEPRIHITNIETDYDYDNNSLYVNIYYTIPGYEDSYETFSIKLGVTHG